MNQHCQKSAVSGDLGVIVIEDPGSRSIDLRDQHVGKGRLTRAKKYFVCPPDFPLLVKLAMVITQATKTLRP